MSIEIVLLPNGFYRCRIQGDRFQTESRHSTLLDAYLQALAYDQKGVTWSLPPGTDQKKLAEKAVEHLKTLLL